MNAVEIAERSPETLTLQGWLKEIAYQIALMNEKPKFDQTFTLPESPKLTMDGLAESTKAIIDDARQKRKYVRKTA